MDIKNNQYGITVNMDSTSETNVTTEHHIEALDISSAVKEIVQDILCQSRRADVHVNIKSTKNYITTAVNSWFYIKITTQSRLDGTILEDKGKNPGLFSALRTMQQFENESHLCMQVQSTLEGEGHGSVRKNLLLQGDILTVVHEITSSKQMIGTVLHLRVHQPVWHMMKECTKVHNYLAQIRLFRPKIELSFSMNVGGAVSETQFSIENRRRLLQSLPSVVIDTKYFLQDSDITPLSEVASGYAGDPTVVHVQTLTPENAYRKISINVTPVAFLVPIEKQTSNIVTLTLYGQGYLPVDTSTQCSILADLNWRKFGLTIDHDEVTTIVKGLLPYHAMLGLKPSSVSHKMDNFILFVFLVFECLDHTDRLQGFQEIEKNVTTILESHASRIQSILQHTIDRLLQPLLNNAKTRSMVLRSIEGISKAVTEIVSMSSCEHFRSSILQSMHVSDTVELKEELNNHLSSISHRKHAGVWRESSCSQVTDIKETKSNQASSASKFRYIDRDPVCSTYEALEGVADDLHQNQIVPKVPFSRICDNGSINTGEKLTNNGSLMTCAVPSSVFVSRQGSNLVIDGNDKETDQVIKDTQKECCTSPVTMKRDVTDPEASPFQQLAVDSPASKIDVTPEMSQIIKGMQEVSPFQELACDQRLGSDSPEVISEDPCARVDPSSSVRAMTQTGCSYRQRCHTQVQNTITSSWEASALDAKYEIEKLNRDHETAMLNDETKAKSDLATSQPQGQVTTVQSDFDFVSSEDFKHDFENVSVYKEPVQFSEPQHQVTENSALMVNIDCFRKGTNLSEMHGQCNVNLEKCDLKDVCSGSKTSTGADLVGECIGIGTNAETVKDKDIGDIEDWFNDVLVEADEWLV